LTPEQRSLRSSIASNERWGRTPRSERVAAGERGQKGLQARFEREADPDGTMPPDERARQGNRLFRAYMSRMALARSRKAGGGGADAT
jgi:hypothetical protein